MATMRAARLHQIGKNFSVDTLEVPKPRSTDVLVKVRACGVIPNMKRFPLHDIASALDAIEKRSGGFTNVVIAHE